ncbi:hypothetical protein THIX_90192 [Thiomonas sp. X19]|uniref:hypothetical protein n=1 Tax=Thiomonas sp. X19 TaxID=1050370 RepID=UPI000B6AA75D|nr:hypothetical protein [Thiomonas sp. X19]SCC95423.1 hypothetical protein THIX_90192 [Thiomonas sp. X19]
MNLHEKLYSTLTPQQRAVAMFAALARRDDAECDRLNESAPVYTYRAHDLEFRRLLTSSTFMALHTALFIEPEVARYLGCLASMAMLGLDDDVDVDEFNAVQDRFKRIGASVKAYWLAYAETCAGMGIDPDELLRGIGVELSEHARALIGKDVEPDPVLLASASELMGQLAGSVSTARLADS